MEDFHRFLNTRGFSAQGENHFAYLWGKIVEPRHLPRLSRDIRPAERAIIWTETDMIKGLPTALKLWQTGEFAHLIISGGDYGKEKERGNLPSVDMLRRFLTACRKRGLCPRGVTIENYSKHTGWQRVVLASVLKSLPDPTQSEPGFVTIREVILVAPRYHILRFTLSLMYGFLQGKIRIRIRTAPFGRWGTRHPQKEATYRNLFWNKVGCEEGDEIGKILCYQKSNQVPKWSRAVAYLKRNG